MRASNLKTNINIHIHITPFQFVKNNYFKFLQGSVATLFRWSWKILSYLWLIYPRHCVSISIKIGQVL